VSTPFIAEIRVFGCNFAPYGWAFCDGQLMAISQNTALFSIIGTYYGGNGKTTFALPDMRGNAPIASGTSSSSSSYMIGDVGGSSTVQLTESTVPAHTHALQADARPALLPSPSPQNSLARTDPAIYKQPSGAAQPQPLAPGAIQPNGGGHPHNNMMPYLTLNFCIALQGIFPPRS
jgi:microcystin-dependent protein